MEALITVSLSWQQGSLQSIWVLDLWTADGHWTAAIHQTVLPSALSINVTEHQHYILPNIYKVKFVSSLIFASLSSGFHALLFLPPSQKVLLIPDPQLTTLLQSLGFAVLKSRISTLLPSSMVKVNSCLSWETNGMVLQPVVLHLSVGFHLSHEFHTKFGILRSRADPFGRKWPVWPNYIVALEGKREGTRSAFCSFADP